MRADWVRDVIADSRRTGTAPFLKQWGTYANNPLVTEFGRSEAEARALDGHGKGGGRLDGALIREFPASRDRICTAMSAA
jgi:hypothetical protein